jgi:hypothetical protein
VSNDDLPGGAHHDGERLTDHLIFIQGLVHHSRSWYVLHFIKDNDQWETRGSRRWQMIDIGMGLWWCPFLILFGRHLEIQIIFPFPLTPAQ